MAYSLHRVCFRCMFQSEAHNVEAIISWSGVFRASERLNSVNSSIACAVSLACIWEWSGHQLCFIFPADDYSISLDLY